MLLLVLVGELTTNWIDRSQAPREQLDVQVLFSELIFVGLHFSIVLEKVLRADCSHISISCLT